MLPDLTFSQKAFPQKVLIVGLLLALLIVFQGTLSLVNFYHAKDTLQSLNNDTFAALYWAGKLKGVAKDQRIAIIFYIYSNNKEDMAKYASVVEDTQAQLKQIREHYPKTNPHDSEGIKQSAIEQDKFYEAWQEIRDFKAQGKEQEAWDIYDSKLTSATLGRRKMEDYLAKVDEEQGQNYLTLAQRSLTVAITWAWIIMLISLAFSSIILLGFYKSLYRSNLKLEGEISRSNHLAREAEFANEAKTRFLTNMSHELRTPLNAIIGMTELLEYDSLRPDVEECLRTIHASGNILLALVNDILDLSKIEANRIELENAPMDLRICAEDALTIISPLAAEKALQISYSIDPEFPSKVFGDSLRLRQVLLNLLMNAVKFTEQGGVTLSISLSKTTDEGKEAKFMISDTGIGITDQGMEQLFKNFSQVDSSVSRLYGGTGLGLSISQKLVRLMGGYITVESIPAKGSTFSFVLPFTIAPSKSTVSTEASSEKTAASAPGKQFPLNILVAEDNKVNQQVIELMLHRLGYEMVVMAHNGQEVLHALEMDRFDLILMDIQMPVMNGLDTTRAILEKYPAPERPQIIALTANATKEDRDICIGIGMQDYLSKPLFREKLLTALSEAYYRIHSQ